MDKGLKPTNLPIFLIFCYNSCSSDSPSDRGSRHILTPRLPLSSPSGTPRSLLSYCFAVAIITIAILAFLDSRSSIAAPKPSPRLIHTHGLSDDSRAPVHRENPQRLERTPITIKTELSDPAKDATTFDDESADPIERRTQQFDAWRKTSQYWLEIDSSLRGCTRMKFINGFVGREPEDALDECLAQAEKEEVERAEREANGFVSQEDFE